MSSQRGRNDAVAKGSNSGDGRSVNVSIGWSRVEIRNPIKGINQRRFKAHRGRYDPATKESSSQEGRPR